MEDTNTHHSTTGCLSIVGIGLFALLVLLFFMFRTAKNHSLDRVDGVGLMQALQRWVKAGKPEGEKLTEFMQGRIGDPIVISNRVFRIDGTNYLTQFAATKLRSHRDATLFVTTNEVLIWLDSSGNVEIFSMNPSRP